MLDFQVKSEGEFKKMLINRSSYGPKVVTATLCAAIIFLLGSECAENAGYSKPLPQAAPPKLRLSETVHDFGDV